MSPSGASGNKAGSGSGGMGSGVSSPGEFGTGGAGGSTASAGMGGGGEGAGGAPVEEKCDMVIPPSKDCTASSRRAIGALVHARHASVRSLRGQDDEPLQACRAGARRAWLQRDRKQPIPVIAFDDMPDFAWQNSVDAKDAIVKANNCKGAEKVWVTVDSK
jgi:hypothetical protein